MGNVSEKDSVYSTDDEVVRPVVKRKKKTNTIASSSDSDEDSDIDIRPKIIGKRRSCKSDDDAVGLNEVESNRNSSDAINNQSDSEQVDKCPICLSKFLGQDIATPEACDHVFCLECLLEWSKNVNTCPIDRLKFNLILIRHHKEEKVIKTIIVNNSELPYSSDAETESSAQYQIAFCDFCTEEGLADCFVRCVYCRKFYHYFCLVSRSSSNILICPTCENDISLSAELLMRHRPQLLRSPFHNRRRRRGYIQATDLLIRQRFPCEAPLNRSLLSTSESSEEDTTDNLPISSRLYQNSTISSIPSSDSPLLKKRRNAICHPRGRALVSSAVSATSETRSLFREDSDDECNDLRLSSAPVPENYDLVGSILQSQTLLHAPDVLTLSRDGSLLRNSKQENSPRRFSMNTSPMQNSGESNQSSLPDSSFFSDGTVSPYNGDVVVKQKPLNPTQNNSTKYGEAPKQTHSSASSGSSMERSLSYNENSVARHALGSNNNDHYSNDPCSPIGQKNYCSSSAADDSKKDRPGKSQHSEDEVDIYSDIESVGEEDGSLSDRVEPMKISFKCEDSQLSNPNDASDSSDNDLVIDEDMHAEEEDKAKDNQESYASSKLKSSQNKNSVPNCESEESNASSNAGSDDEQLTIEETKSENPRPSFIDNSSDNCYNPTEESPARFQNDDSNVSKLSGENDTALKNESDSDANPQESDVDMQEFDENSLDSAKKSFQADANTPCTSVKSSPKSYRGETSDGFEIQCDNSVSNENSRCGENSGFEQDSKEVFEEASNQENTCDSVSQGGENENLASENNSNLSEATSQVEANENFQNEQNSNLSFGSDQKNADASEPDDFVDSNLSPVRGSSPIKEKAANTSNDVSMRSDEEDNLDSIENASTPCLDENQDGMLENSPVAEDNEDTGHDFEASPKNTAEIGKDDDDDDSTANEEITSEKMECDAPSTVKMSDKDSHDNTVDLGIEDISDAGSDDLRDEFTDEVSASDKKETEEQKVASPFSPNRSEAAEEEKTDEVPEDANKSQSNQSFEDHEEGEIIEERPHRCNRRRKERLREEANYTEYNPRVNISDLPRIPKLKRDKDKENVSEVITFENKRTSVLSRVDLGDSADISWKRLSKHTRERSYRDGRPKDERLLYRERESRNKDKNSGESSRRSEKNSEHRREEKKQEAEKSKKEYESRSRKTEKSKSDEWSYSEREKRKSRKDKHSKDKHSKDKKEKDKHDKTKHSKDESKYEREKTKDDSRYERDSRYDKEERFERIVYEKGKLKEKEHKSKHKDRKGDVKSSKDHSREKHKHSHSSNDHFSDKQREREVRKIDDKIKIVVEQKDSRKEKSKHKERKETKHDKKVVQRKVESERIPYTESTSIESKEIFAKGDSIIINVNFNRASSPKNNLTVEGSEPISKDRKVTSEELDKEDQVSPEEVKSKPKHSNTDKVKSSHETGATKRPSTPPKNNPVLSVSESYWQGGDDADDNSRSSDKSIVEIQIDDSDEESPNAFESSNLSNGGSSLDPTPTVLKDTNSNAEEPASAPEKEATPTFPKEPESFASKRRSPRSPSPPSPADNDSYDPCEPTKSPSPPPMPPAPPLPTINPKPPPSPELPPLPPEPEPMDNEPPIKPPEFASIPPVMVSSSAQPVTVSIQTASPLPMQSMMLPPPSFLSQVSSAASMPNMIVPPRSGSFQMSGHHHPVLLPSNHIPQVMGGSFPPMHGGTTLPPPPNPPNMPHMGSVPPPPPPPAGITLLPQVRHHHHHHHLGVHPPMNPTSLLQSLAMGHGAPPPLQLVHQLPPNLSGILANQAQMVRNAQNQLASLPVSIANQQGPRMVLSQNPMLNHGTLFQNQNLNDCNKTQGNAANLLPPHTQIMSGGLQMSDKLPKTSPPPAADKNEVVDMDVDTPYSPACSPSVDSVGDYSPTCSPIPSSPKSKDVFDTLLPSDQRTSEKRTHDAVAGSEKSKQHSSKKSKHEHKSDSKVRHAVRMQVKDKHKKSRKEHKQTDRKESNSMLEDTQLKILDELPSSAVEMQVKEKFLKKLNRQERVVEEVKFALKPYYKSRDVTKEEYKDILRKSVPKICHNKSGEINPVKVKYLVECYVKKAKHSRKKGEKKKSTLS